MTRPLKGPGLSRNTFLLLLSQLLGQAAALVISIKVAAYLGVTGYGIYTFVFSFTTLFTFAVDWGLAFSLLRTMSNDRDVIGMHYLNALAIKAILGAGVIAAYLIIAGISGIPVRLGAALLFGFVLLALTGLQTMTFMVLQALERLDIQALFHAGNRLTVLVLVTMLAIPADLGLNGILLMPVIAAVLFFICGTALVSRLTGASLSYRMIRPRQWSSMLRTALPFAFIGILNQLYLHVDVAMLKFMRDDYTVGIYAIPARIVAVGLLAPAAFVSALFPRLNRIADPDHFGRTVRTSFKYLLAAGIAAGILLFWWSGPLIGMLYGPDFLPAVPVISVIVWALVLMFGNWILGHALYARHKEKQMLGVVGGTVGVNVMLNAVLIPVYGAFGAALATVASEIVIMALEVMLLRRAEVRLSGNGLIRVVLAGVVALGLTAALSLTLPPGLTGLAGSIVYLLALVALRAVSWKEIRSLEEARA